MSVSASESTLSRWAAFGELSSALAEGVLCAQAVGLWGSSRALVLAALLRDTGRPILAIHASAADRHRSALDVASFVASLAESSGRDALPPSSRVLEFPSEQPVSWHGGRHREHDAERALCCHRLLTGEAVAVMTTPAALSLPLLPPREFRARTLSLAPGQSIEREALLEALERAGYERVDAVTEVGQWSLRGGIVDVFSPTHERPVRAEFFGDEVESLRVFDPTSQRSVEPVKELAVLPLVREREGTAGLTAYLPGTRSWCSRIPPCSTRLPTTRRRPSHWPPSSWTSSDWSFRSWRDRRRRGRGSPWARAPWEASGVSSRRWPPRSADGAGRASPCGSWWTTSGRRSGSGACCPSTSSRPGRA